jgi:hypothetical protein
MAQVWRKFRPVEIISIFSATNRSACGKSHLLRHLCVIEDACAALRRAERQVLLHLYSSGM